MDGSVTGGAGVAHGSREERRLRSEATILAAAREMFAEQGFERTTIRGVAARAGCDPALVMQHFGNKEGLFAAAARWPSDHERILTATSDTLVGAALQDLFAHFESPEEAAGAAALMRSCLTHSSAAQVMRDDVMCERTAHVEQALEGDDTALRAALFGACMLGLGVSRYLLEVPPLATASREDVERLMAPVLDALVRPAGQPPAAGS